MKQLLLILLPLVIFSCKKDAACTEISFGESIILATDTQVCIDGTEYTFKAKDERCCCGCVCVWEGEFLLMFEDADGNVVYTYHEAEHLGNTSPPFAESMELTSITNQVPDCGDDSKIDEVRFTILIN